MNKEIKTAVNDLKSELLHFLYMFIEGEYVFPERITVTDHCSMPEEYEGERIWNTEYRMLYRDFEGDLQVEYYEIEDGVVNGPFNDIIDNHSTKNILTIVDSLGALIDYYELLS